MSAAQVPVRQLAQIGAREVSFSRAARSVLRSVLESSIGDRLCWRLPAHASGAALTFDDGPDPDHTPEVLRILAFYEARATFFVVGDAARQHPELVRRMLHEGHAVGNHTDTHVHCPGLFHERFRHEVRAADATIEWIAPGSPQPAFRPPFGAISPAQVADMLRQGRRVVLWNRDSRDYRSAGADEIAQLGDSLRRRDILLMHDRFDATVEALPRILEGLHKRGIQALSINDAVTRARKRIGREEPILLKTIGAEVRRRWAGGRAGRNHQGL